MKHWDISDIKSKGFFVDSTGKGKKLKNIPQELPKDYIRFNKTLCTISGNKIGLFIKVLSVNDAWKGKRFRSEEYKSYQKLVGYSLPKIELPEPPFEVCFKFGFSSVNSDWDNPVKPLQDCLSKKYGFNDKLIRRAIVETEIVEIGLDYFEFEIKHYVEKQ